MHGQFIWYELTTPDVDAARKFYPRFTSWGTQAFDKDYTMWTSGGEPIAGLFRLTEEMQQQGVPPNWMPYVESDDVDATAAKAASLGGQVIHGPGDIPGAGRYAVLQDPQGAVFGVYKSTTGARGWDGTAVVGRFSWHELMTTDYVSAFEFYRALFGWDKTGEMDMGGGQMYSMYGKGEKMYGGMFDRPPEMAAMPPFWLVYIHVKDVAKAVAAATKGGATVIRPQMDIPGGGAIAILGDPQGAGFAVHHASAAAAAATSPTKTPVKTAVKKTVAAVKKAVKAAKKAATGGAKRARKKLATTKAATKKAATKKATKKAAARKSATKKSATRSSRRPTRGVTRPKAKGKAASRRKTSARPNVRARTKSRTAAKSAGRRSTRAASRGARTARARKR